MTSNREHHWDALRATLMLLGIPYHVAMSYRADAVWILNSGEGMPAMNILAELIHVVRMPAFFLIAGYFAIVTLARRSAGAWFSARLLRLLVPFLAAMLTLNPLLNIFCELTNFRLAEALVSLERNSVGSAGYALRHLWFIIVLLYCLGGAALLSRIMPKRLHAPVRPDLDEKLAARIALTCLGAGIAMGIWAALAVEAFYTAGLATRVPQEMLRLDQLIEFAPWFAAGGLLARARACREALHRFSPVLFVVTAVVLALHIRFSEELHPAADRFIATVAAMGMTQTLLALFKAFASRPSPMIRELVSGAFVIYLVHLPIIAGLVLLGKSMALPLPLKAMLVTTGTVALSWALWRIIAQRPALRFLYDGTLVASTPASSPQCPHGMKTRNA